MDDGSKASNMVPNHTDDLIPNMIDQRAENHPDQSYAEYTVSSSTYDEGYRKITYKDFSNAINGVAWWIYDTLGAGDSHEVLAYIGPNDLMYPALIVGAVKAGYLVRLLMPARSMMNAHETQMFLTSPRNSVAAQVSLFDRLGCKTLLTSSVPPPAVTAILDERHMRIFEVPSVESLLDKTYECYPYGRELPAALSEPFFAVHTSGSTGIPKPIVYTHSTIAMNIRMVSLDPPAGYESLNRMYQGKCVFLTFPPFHGAYLVGHFINAVPFGSVMITPRSGTIPSAEGLVESLKQTSADIAFLVPSIVQELSKRPDLLEYCSENLESIIYCGGDLPSAIGNVVASKIKLYNQFGATELGLTTQILPKDSRKPEDWKYAQFHPDVGFEFCEVSADTYELCVSRDPKKTDLQPTFTLFPDLDRYASRDLFVHHPSTEKPDMWSWQARADDIIVFLNGEKTNPISVEQYIVSETLEVAAALVVGAQRFQAALLVEPVNNKRRMSGSERAVFINCIWPKIQEANRSTPAHARIAKTHILLTHFNKPMLRAGKGTVQRSGTVRLYMNEIDSLYADADTMLADASDGDDSTINIEDTQNVESCVRKAILSITDWGYLSNDADLFTLGLDSLQTLLLVRRLRQGLSMPTLGPSMVYSNSSVSALVAAISSLAVNEKHSKTTQNDQRNQRLGKVMKKYQDRIETIIKRTPPHGRFEGHTVLLTGSTGALGSHILERLLKGQVKHVYCLNRAVDSKLLQCTRNSSYGLNMDLDPERVTFLTVDLAQNAFGLSHETYDMLLSTATTFIHNAWPVNFNFSLQAFEPQLEGIVKIISFVSKAARSVHLSFISSISSALSYRSSPPIVPEEIIMDTSAPASNGYAESKYVAERLLDYASQRLSLQTSVARVGQIAGPVTHAGLWNKAEWFPSLVMSSLHVGALPDSLGAMGFIDWVPIDVCADVLVDLALRDSNGSESRSGTAQSDLDGERRARVFHVVNPHPVKWEDGKIRSTVIDALSSMTAAKEPSLKVVAPSDWLKAVRRSSIEAAPGSHDLVEEEKLQAALRANPAVKLLDFFEEVLFRNGDGASMAWQLEKTMRASGKMKDVEAIKPEWMRKWIDEWFASI